jgi:tRNA-Thr(GGU) m(6)t(6)A37 methyltransferase TsaA
MREPVKFEPVGVVHSEFAEPAGVPIQPYAARGVPGTVEVFPEYGGGLADLDGFSHIILLLHYHLARPYKLKVKPFMDDAERGLFATRAPSRPNPIGLSVVRLEKIEGATLHILDVDIVDGTPVLDIKPYVPQMGAAGGEVRIGWLEERIGALGEMTADERFMEDGT